MTTNEEEAKLGLTVLALNSIMEGVDKNLRLSRIARSKKEERI